MIPIYGLTLNLTKKMDCSDLRKAAIVWREKPVSDDGFAAFKAVADEVVSKGTTMIRAAFFKAGGSGTPPVFRMDGKTVSLGDGMSLWGILRFDRDRGYCRIRETGPEIQARAARRVTDIELVRQGGDVRMTTRVFVKPVGRRVMPLEAFVRPPDIVSWVVDNFPCLSMGWPVRTRPFAVNEAMVPVLADIILDPDRGFPVVIASRHAFTGESQVDAAFVQSRLPGMCLVADLIDRQASFTLSDLIGRDLGAYNGAVRTCWPGAGQVDDSARHDLVLPLDIEKDPAGFQYRLVKGIAMAVTARVDFPYLSKCVTDSFGVTGLVPDSVPAPGKTGDLKDKSDKDVIASLRAQVRDLKRQIGQCRRELPAGRRFATMEQAVRQAVEDFSPVLVFLDEAFESAAGSEYANPNKAYGFLKALHEVAQLWRRRKGVLNTSWFEAMKRRGFTVKDGVSEVTEAKWGAEYEYMYRGDKVLFTYHCTIGVSHDPRRIFSVYWHLDRDRLVVVVGRCGRHPSNTKS